jgi:hypothetical protein
MRRAQMWRFEAEQQLSPWTQRLLAWIESTPHAPHSTVECGADLSRAWGRLLEADAVLVVGRSALQEPLRALALWREGSITWREDESPFPSPPAPEPAAPEAEPLPAPFLMPQWDAAFDLADSDSIGEPSPAQQQPSPVAESSSESDGWALREPTWFDEAPGSLRHKLIALVEEARRSQPDYVGGVAPALSAELYTAPVADSENALGDFSTAPEPPSGFAAEDPALVVPLYLGPEAEAATGSGAEIWGTALVWMRTADGAQPLEWRHVLHSCGQQSGAWLQSAARAERIGRSYRDLAQVVARAAEARDEHRRGRSADVAYIAGLIARKLGLSEVDADRIEMAGLLHDIGRADMADWLLAKKSLSHEDRDEVRASLMEGARWLEDVEGLEEVALIVRHQNERWDGAGFPEGLAGEAIPLGARILAVAVRFVAMTRPRSDRGALSVVGGAFEWLLAEEGRALDPRLVHVFLASMGRRA